VTEDAPYLLDPAGRRFSLARPTTSIGRSPACDLYIPDRRASRRHAEIAWDGEDCTLSDLDSDNGTFLNGLRLAAPQPLTDGDQIAVASAVFIFRDPEATLREARVPRLFIDPVSGDLTVNRRPVSLSAKERLLFDLLYQHAGRPCTKAEIAAAVWPEYYTAAADYQVESLVKRLREKLESDPRQPTLLLTRPWLQVGHRLNSWPIVGRLLAPHQALAPWSCYTKHQNNSIRSKEL
jgi:FHA domain